MENNCKRKCISCDFVEVGYIESILPDKTLMILFDNFYYPADKDEIMFNKKIEVGSKICRNKANQLKSCKFILN
jgi:hypothetical protein